MEKRISFQSVTLGDIIFDQKGGPNDVLSWDWRTSREARIIYMIIYLFVYLFIYVHICLFIQLFKIY